MSDEIEVDDVEEGGRVHSKLGPSSMKRWRNCTGSPNLVRKLGDKARKSGIEAAEGTAAHTLMEQCLRGGEDAWEHTGDKITVDKWTFTVDQEMVDGVQMMIDWVRDKQRKFPTGILVVEARVGSVEDEDAFGTLDVGIYVPNERLLINDFKYGKGVPVEPDDDQLKSYGHYSFETFVQFKDVGVTDKRANETLFIDPNTICELYITQPRFIGHEKGPIRRYVTTRAELSRWFYGEVLPAMADTRKPDAPLVIGDHCKFCPASDHCPQQHKEVEAFPVGIEPETLTDEQLDVLCFKAEAIIKQHERNKKEIFNRAMGTGKAKFNHYKLVRSIGHRIWKSGAEDVLSQLGSIAYTDPELKSPAQIEGLKGNPTVTLDVNGEPVTYTAKQLVQKYAMKPETGLTIALRTDRREEQTTQMGAFDKSMGNEQEAA